jgi:hypothetical protein
MSDDQSRVWIAQCLCPQRHAILAAAGVAHDRADAELTVLGPLIGRVRKLCTDEIINPWCGLCKAPEADWRYEVGRTRFTSMAEAETTLRGSEAAQSIVRRAFGS